MTSTAVGIPLVGTSDEGVTQMDSVRHTFASSCPTFNLIVFLSLLYKARTPVLSISYFYFIFLKFESAF